jgi:hypothetical protein
MQITQQPAGQKSSAELTLLLYGWDGDDTSFAGIMHRLPFAGAAKVTLAGQSSRLVSRAATFLTPRATPRSARLRRQNTTPSGVSMMDDMTSVASMPVHGNHNQ